MRRHIFNLFVLSVLVLLGWGAGAACTGEQRQNVRTALEVADEACDVAVLLEDRAEYVCVPIDKIEAVGRVLLKNSTTTPAKTNRAKLMVRKEDGWIAIETAHEPAPTLIVDAGTDEPND